MSRVKRNAEKVGMNAHIQLQNSIDPCGDRKGISAALYTSGYKYKNYEKLIITYIHQRRGTGTHGNFITPSRDVHGDNSNRSMLQPSSPFGCREEKSSTISSPIKLPVSQSVYQSANILPPKKKK